MSTQAHRETFTPSVRWRLAMLAIGVLPTTVYLVGEGWLLHRMTPDLWAFPVEPFGMPLGVRTLVLLPLGFTPLAVVWTIIRLATVVVTEDGLTIHHIWKIRWRDVASARTRTVLGSKDLRVSRGRGRFSVSVPIDYVGRRSLAEALAERAPAGNPIREALKNPE